MNKLAFALAFVFLYSICVAANPTPSKDAPTAQQIPSERLKTSEKRLKQGEASIYGRKVSGLPYEKVDVILRNKRIYEGEMDPSNFLRNGIHSKHHPFSKTTQATCIAHSTASLTEKEALWNLFFYRNFAFVKFYFDQLGTFRFTLKKTPKKIYAEYYGPLTWKHFSERAATLRDPVLVCVGLGLCIGGALHKACSAASFPRAGDVLLLGSLSVSTLAGILIGIHDILNALKPSSTEVKCIEKMIASHVSDVVRLHAQLNENNQKEFPLYFAEELKTLLRELSEVDYNPDGKFDADKFKDWLDIVMEYYENLEARSTIAKTVENPA